MNMIRKILSLSFLLLLHCTITSAQSPAAAPVHAPSKAPAAKAKAPASTKAPPPSESTSAPPPAMVPVQTSKGPLNIVKVLQKAGHFAFFIRLIRTTQEDLQFASQLNSSTDGLSIFAPTDGAFSSIIKAGTLNALTDQEKIQLVQFHVLPRFLSTAQFQTVSNPLKTLAGSGKGFQLNVTTTDSLVNVTTGLTNTSVSGIVYTDNQVAIYQVDKVLLPGYLFGPKALAPAPASPKPEKDEGAESPSLPKDTSSSVPSVVNGLRVMMFGLATAAAIFLL